MKKALTLILLFVLSGVAIVVGRANGWDWLMYFGVVFGSATALAIVLGVVKLFGKFVSDSISSALFGIVSLTIIGILAWQGTINSLLSFGLGVVFSMALTIVFYRKIASKAQKSIIFGEIFSKVSNYQIRSFIHDDGLAPKEQQININLDYKNLILVLRDMGYTKDEAKEASEWALKEVPETATLEDKVRKALQYNSVALYKNQNN